MKAIVVERTRLCHNCGAGADATPCLKAPAAPSHGGKGLTGKSELFSTDCDPLMAPRFAPQAGVAINGTAFESGRLPW